MGSNDAATVIIGQRVRPEHENEFLRWQKDLNNIASTYPGFIGAEINAPTAVQQDWVVIYRFDSTANLSAWLNSAPAKTGSRALSSISLGPPLSRSSEVRRNPLINS